jgi:hypothetical protein
LMVLAQSIAGVRQFSSLLLWLERSNA